MVAPPVWRTIPIFGLFNVSILTIFFSLKISADKDRDAFKAVVGRINQKMETLKAVTPQIKRPTLSSFCPMLSNYHWYGSIDKFIELPGQHMGNASPNPKTTLKIVKFNENISILKSLRSPIKISCICSDGKSYSFLVKYGEDLRQDERIQHVQELMSAQMHLDKNCSQQKLSFRSYRVIPLNTFCGLISWIDNTDTIDAFLSNNGRDAAWKAANAKAQAQYLTFITSSKQALIKSNTRIEENNVRVVVAYPRQKVSKSFVTALRHLHQFILWLFIFNSFHSDCGEF